MPLFRRAKTVADVLTPLNRALKALERIADQKVAESTKLMHQISELYDQRDDAEQEAAKAQRLHSKISKLVEE